MKEEVLRTLLFGGVPGLVLRQIKKKWMKKKDKR